MFDHPREVCMTYVEHFKFSMSLSFKFTEQQLRHLYTLCATMLLY